MAPSTATAALQTRHLGRVDYEPTWRRMQRFTEQRGPETDDELWLLEHAPVFTLGLNARREHLLAPGDIPVVAVDRGGQVTYHGPGQVIAYPLIDLKRRGLGVRRLVTALERSAIAVLATHGLDAHARAEAPGVYVDEAKVASVGLRVRRGCSYHGVAMNVAMDLEPFTRINPCGYAGLAVTDLRSLGIDSSLEAAAQTLAAAIAAELERVGAEDRA